MRPSLEPGKRYVGVQDRDRGGEVSAVGGVDSNLIKGEGAAKVEG